MAQRDEHYIDRLQISDLDKAIEDKTIDKGTEALLRAEMPEIQAWRGVKLAKRALHSRDNHLPRRREEGKAHLSQDGDGRRLSLRPMGYKGINPDFPDQSTADQFFDEEQFEAYRELGYVIGDRMIRSLGLGGLINQAEV